MSEAKKTRVHVTTWDTVDTLPPVLKKIAAELIKLGKIRIVEVPPRNKLPAAPDRRHRK
jgi:hypothetical protein